MKLVVKSFGDPTLANWNAPVSDEEQAKKMTAKFVAGDLFERREVREGQRR
jgi:hypothetical protein